MAEDLAIGRYTVFAEASNQPTAAQLGVAYSIVNRLRSGRFGSTIAAVCLEWEQYSSWNGDRGDRSDLLRAATVADDDPAYQACCAALQAAIDGSQPDPTGGATHYYDTSVQAPYWALPPAQVSARLGDLIFYTGVA